MSLKGLMENRYSLSKLDVHLEHGMDAMLKIEAKREKKAVRKFWFRPSSFKPCNRAMYYSFIGANRDKRPTDYRGQRIFKNGDDVHTRIQKWAVLGKIAVPASIEPFFQIPSLFMKGNTDGITQLVKSLSILEIKSINDRGFMMLDGPTEDHDMQTHAYMRGHEIKRTDFIYENKNNQEWKTYRTKFKPKVWNTMRGKMAGIIDSVETAKYPNRISNNPNSYSCKWCSYKDHCHGEKSINKRKLKDDWQERKEEKHERIKFDKSLLKENQGIKKRIKASKA